MEYRRAHEVVYELLLKVPTIDEDVLVPRDIKAAPGPKPPVVVQDADLGWLYSILKDPDDARHLYQAFKNECAYFVTTDKEILRKAEEIEDRLTIKLRKPSTLVLELEGLM